MIHVCTDIRETVPVRGPLFGTWPNKFSPNKERGIEMANPTLQSLKSFQDPTFEKHGWVHWRKLSTDLF